MGSLFRAGRLAVIPLVCALGAAPDQGAAQEEKHPGGLAPCAAERRDGGWCAAQGVGYVAGVEIVSASLFEALDAHGHSIHAPSLTCDTCRRAMASDGFCAEHRMGFVEGLAYLSPLTYHLARAEPVAPEAISCRTCRASMRSIGWCEEHEVGMVGERRVHDPADFAVLSQAYHLLLAAIEKSRECESCAAAMVAHGYCPEHRLHYAGGRVKAP